MSHGDTLRAKAAASKRKNKPFPVQILTIVRSVVRGVDRAATFLGLPTTAEARRRSRERDAHGSGAAPNQNDGAQVDTPAPTMRPGKVVGVEVVPSARRKRETAVLVVLCPELNIQKSPP